MDGTGRHGLKQDNSDLDRQIPHVLFHMWIQPGLLCSFAAVIDTDQKQLGEQSVYLAYRLESRKVKAFKAGM